MNTHKAYEDVNSSVLRSFQKNKHFRHDALSILNEFNNIKGLKLKVSSIYNVINHIDADKELKKNVIEALEYYKEKTGLTISIDNNLPSNENPNKKINLLDQDSDVNEVLTNFSNNGYSNIDIPLKKDFLQETVNSFKDFLDNSSDDNKKSTYYRYNEELRVSHGYRGENDDQKGYFHYHPDVKKRHFLPANDSYNKFIKNIDKVYEKIELQFETFIKKMINEGYEDFDNLLDENGKPSVVIRILSYRAEPDSPSLAKKHLDRGPLTCAFYETDEGLYFEYKKNIVRSSYQEGVGKLFLGEDINHYMNHSSTIFPTGHGVENDGENRQRYAMVGFVNNRHKIK